MKEYAISAADEAQNREMMGVVWSVFQTLRPREQVVIARRFFFGLSFAKIGNELNVSGGRIRQVYIKAIRKMRHEIQSRILCDEL